MTNRIRPALLAPFAIALLSGCHTVGFHPVPAPTFEARLPAAVSLHVPAQVRDATYSFRAFGSGIGNRWTVPYGARLQEFARVYLCAAATSCRDATTAEDVDGSDLLIRIRRADYRIEDQAAHVSVRIDAVDGSGRALLEKEYATRGDSGVGTVFTGGVFVQKEVTRSSTDHVFRELFTELVADLERAWRDRGAVRGARAP